MHLFIRRIKFRWIQKMCKLRILRRSVNSRAQIVSNSKSDYMKKLFQTLDHHKLISSASTYETLISQTKPCGDQQETAAKKPKPAIGRHKFHKETEDALNKHITEEFNAAFAYLSMACYFGRTDVSLPGCQGFFMNMYAEELDHALVIANYVLMRGARVVLSSIRVPENQDWKSPENALSSALDMEKSIKEKLGAVFEVAEKHKDLQVMDLISTQFEEEQNRAICELARLVARVKMADDTVGEYLFDRMVYDSFVANRKGNLMYKRDLEEERSNEVYK